MNQNRIYFHTGAKKSKPALVLAILPWILLVGCITASLLAWSQQNQNIQDAARAGFERETEVSYQAIRSRLADYEDILRSGRSLLTVKTDTNRDDWRQFVNTLDLERRYPGMTGMGFVAYVPNEKLNDFIAEQRQFLKDYNVRPPGQRPFYFLVKYTEPFERTGSVLGYDMGSEPVRREAMEFARNTGRTSITGRIKLVQDAVEQPSFIMSVPVYRAGATENRQNFLGWVNASFRLKEFMGGVFAETTGNLAVQIYDSALIDANTLLYDGFDVLPGGYEASLKETRQLYFGGRSWLLRFASTPTFDRQFSSQLSFAVLLVGLGLSIILFLSVAKIVRGRTLALQQARANLERSQESEELFRQATENIDQVFWVTSPDGKKGFYISPAFEQIWGITTEKYYSDPECYTRAIHPDDRAVFEAAQGRKTSGNYQIEYRIVRKDGSVRWINSRAFPVRDAEGKVYRVTGISEDITERKQAQAELEEQHRFASMIMDNMGQGLCVTIDNRFDYVNPAYARMLGYEPDELVGRMSEEMYAPHEQENIRKHRKLRNNGEKTTYETQLVHKDGILVNVLMTGVPYIMGSRIIGSIAVVTDLTERKLAEERLTLQNEYLGALHDTTLALINRLEPGDLLETIVVRAGGLLGTSHGTVCLLEPEGDRMRQALTVGFPSSVIAEYIYPGQGMAGKVWETGKPLFIEDYPTWAGHIEFNFDDFPVRSVAGVPLKSGDTVIGVLSLIYFKRIPALSEEDMSLLERFAQLASLALVNAQLFTAAQNELTERKRTEAALEQARDQALEASRLKSEFVANMSHEIRTPLSGVLGMLELLQETELDAEQRDFAGIALNSAQSLLSLINDILDFSKIEANKLTIENRDFDLTWLLDSVLELFTPTLAEKKLALTTVVDPTVPRWLRGDSNRLRQILLNLVGNAVKFTEKGQIHIRVREEQRYDEQEQALLYFEVEDTGIGLSEVARKRLFQPFTQADGSTTRKYGGTGLGLSISRRLVELMGGEIGVESTEGVGSTFWVRLPLEVLPQPTELPIAPAKNIRVLIVDESDAYREMLTTYLQAWGIRPQTAKNGAEALRHLRRASLATEPLNLVLVNQVLPDMDGANFAKLVQEDANLTETRLILMAAFDTRRQGKQARQAGFSDYLSKPVRQSQLYNSILNVMGATEKPQETPFASPLLLPRPETGAEPTILVAEDNAINQEMALRQLRKLGYAAKIVATGSAAVDAVSRHPFDLILMDCQMPGMDGFEATRLIRKLEASSGRRTPIVALTANALQSDREACFAAGMDDYLTKPVNLNRLHEMLRRWLTEAQANPATTSESNGQRNVEVGQLEATVQISAHAPGNGNASSNGGSSKAANGSVTLDRKMLEGLRELQEEDAPDIVVELIELYFRDAPRLLSQMEVALAQSDAGALRQASHTLKSSSLNLGARRLSELCKEIEMAARAGNWDGVPQILATVRTEFSGVWAALDLERQKERLNVGD